MRRTTPVQVGIFVLAGVLLAIGFYTAIKGGPLEDLRYRRLHVVFDDVQGLSRGAPVHLAGKEIGTVESIELTANNRADVTLKVRRNHDLYRSYLYSIGSASLLGDQRVVVKAKDESGESLAEGQPLQDGDYVWDGISPIGVDALFVDAQLLVADLREAVRTLGDLLGDRETVEATKTAIANISQLTEQGIELLGNVNAGFGDAQTDMRRLLRNLSTASGEVARMARANRAPINRMLTSSANAARSLERLLGSNEREVGRLVRQVADLTEESRRLLVDNRESLDAVLANTARAAQQVDRLLEATREEWPALLQDLRAGMGDLRRLSGAAGEDLAQVAANLRSTTTALDESLDRAQPQLDDVLREWQQTSQEFRRLSQRTRELWVEEGAAEQIGATLRTIGATMEDVRETTASLRALLTDPELQEDLKGAVSAGRAAMEQAGGLVERAGDLLDKGLFGGVGRVKTRSEFDFQWVPEGGRFTTDLDLYASWPSGGLVRLGVADVGEDNGLNLQVGRQLSPRHALRLGLYRSKMGAGWDAVWSWRWTSSVDLYDPNQGLGSWETRYRLSPRWWVIGGVQQIFDDPELYAGVRFGGD